MAGNISAKMSEESLTENDVSEKLPPRLFSTLMAFQKEGVLWAIRKNGRCLIADEMGLGKTLQAIAVAFYFQSEWPLLIIVPSSLRYVWIEELERWLPDLRPQDINLIQGGFDTAAISSAKITIVTYGLLSSKTSAAIKEALKGQKFKVAICDESHYFKNSRTECCKAVSSLLTCANRLMLLSGTPAVAKPAELFTQLDVLMPGKFGSFWSFTKRYCAAYWQHFGHRKHWKTDGASNLRELQERLSAVMIRREKGSVLTQLPPKQRQKILFPLKDSQTKKDILSAFAELTPLLKRSDSSLATNLLGEDRGGNVPDGVNGPEYKDSNILSRIQKINILTCDAKIGPVREYVQMQCENDNLKFLVFAYHHAMMDGIQQTLRDKKVKFVRIDGLTKPSDRQLYVQQFQNDKETRVAILSILAAGTGLTLTAASLVVFAELYWTPGVMVQCEDRAHRIGQTSALSVHYLVARETMDEWVWAAVCRKTLVTSRALTGKRRSLQAAGADPHQVELLSAAEAYEPPAATDTVDVMELIMSQRPQDQKSILDFFSSQPEPSQSPSASSQLLSCSSQESPSRPATSVSAASFSKGGTNHFSPVSTWGKPSLQLSRSQASEESIVVDSSDEEVSSCEEKDDDAKNQTTPEENRKQTPMQNKKESFGNFGNRHLATPMQNVLRKRKQTFADDADENFDSEFENSPSIFQSPESKRKKLGASPKRKSAAHRTPRLSKKAKLKNTSKGKVSVTKSSQVGTPRETCKIETEKMKKWSCPACTFANNSLLPFCEMCETPKKEETTRAIKDRVKNKPDVTSCSEVVLDDGYKTVNKSSMPISEKGLLASLSSNFAEVKPIENEEIIPIISVKNETHNVKRNLQLDTESDLLAIESSESLVSGQIKNKGRSSEVDSDLCGRSSYPPPLQSLGDSSLLASPISGQETAEGKENSGVNVIEDLSLGLLESDEGDVKEDFTLNFSDEEEYMSSLSSQEPVQESSLCSEEEQEGVSSDGDKTLSSVGADHYVQSEDMSEDSKTPSDSIDLQSSQQESNHLQSGCRLHQFFSFCCSSFTGRVHIFDEAGESLKVNFLPLDVELNNIEDFPPWVQHPHHLRLLNTFVRQWNSLSDTKRRLITKRNLTFRNPLAAYDLVRTDLTNNKQRHQTKRDQAQAALRTAQKVKGNVRIVSRGRQSAVDSNPGRTGVARSASGSRQDVGEAIQSGCDGYVQVMSADGRPLCLHCQQACSTLVSTETQKKDDNAWSTRFCSMVCADAYWMKTNSSYLRKSIYDIQHGVCQLCGFDAHTFYCQVRDCVDMKQRAEKINCNRTFSRLSAKQKKQIIARPYEGMFWHVDHIRPVWEGGGQCDIDNLRTLCLPCHVSVTTKQTAQRVRERRLSKGAPAGDITAFFRKK